MRKATLAMSLAALLMGCAVGPDYVRPQAPAATDFPREAQLYEPAAPVAEFWRGFQDPLLTQLVEEALAGNTDLRVTLARLNQARALMRQQRLDLLPTVTAEAGKTWSRASAAQAPGVPLDQRTSELNNAELGASWELDLFGRVRRSVEASHAEAEAVAADLRAVQVSIAAEVARTYFELRGQQEQLRVALRNADNQRETLQLTQLRLGAGRGTSFDTQRGQAQLSLTLSRVPALEAEVAASAHRLAVLEGREPQALLERLAVPATLPVLPTQVAVGSPADLLRRRPDVQAAERRLAAATARIGVATADLFPRLTLGGSIGASAQNLGDLFTREGETYAFGPGISWAFLDLGRVRARIDASDARTQGQLAAYEGTVLKALEETENALVRHARARSERDHLADAVDAAKAASGLAHVRFEGGVSDFLQVLDSERSQLDAEQRLADSQTRTATALVAVYKAVAGGWPGRVVAGQAAPHVD